jgi:hypothetical protein
MQKENMSEKLKTILENYSVALLEWKSKNPEADLKELQIFAKKWAESYLQPTSKPRT